MRARAVASERRCVVVDWRCRESEGKAKIEGYMSVSDEEAHHCAYHRCRDDGGVWRERLREWYNFPSRACLVIVSLKGHGQMGWSLECVIRDACHQP